MKKYLCQLLLLCCIALISTDSYSEDRLNIVIIVADDWGGPYASAYNGIHEHNPLNSVVKTPNIDRIAKNGVLFKNAYVNAPSCTASRSSIFSGRYFFNTQGGAFLGGKWDSSIPTFPVLLHDAGYHIGNTYKTWAPGRPVNAAFGGTAHSYNKAGTMPNRFSGWVTKYMAKGWTFAGAKQKMLDQIRGNFEDFLADRKPNQPFLYWFGPYNTHRSWQKGSGKALWGINPDTLKGKLHIFLPDKPEIREDVADYLGEIQALDAYVGVLLKKLEEIGELERTLIVVTGDNGPGGFPHGKWNLYDFGVAVPLVMWLPQSTGGRVVTDFTTLMDLAPTILDLAGVPIPPKVDGRSLLPILKSPNSGQVDPERTFAITGEERHTSCARDDCLPYPVRALRTANYLYIRNFASKRWPMGCPYIQTLTGNGLLFFDMDRSPTKNWIILNRNNRDTKKYYNWAFAKREEEQLFDLSKDPEQITNVAYKPVYAAIKAQLANQLLIELQKTGDPRVIGDGKVFDKSPYVNLKPVACQLSIPLGWSPN